MLAIYLISFGKFDCDIFIINCAFVKTKIFNIKIKNCLLILLRDIDVTKYVLNK